MPNDRTLCPLCAWRGDCARRFSMGGDATLHCPEYTEDVLLRRQRQRGAEPSSTTGND